MGNFGVGEMLMIAVFGLLVFGPQRLPEMARNVGGFIREFKAAAGGLTSELKAEIEAPAKARPAEAVPAEPQPDATDENTPGATDRLEQTA